MQKLLHLILSLKGGTSLLLSTWEVIHTKMEHIKLRHLKMNQKKKNCSQEAHDLYTSLMVHLYYPDLRRLSIFNVFLI